MEEEPVVLGTTDNLTGPSARETWILKGNLEPSEMGSSYLINFQWAIQPNFNISELFSNIGISETNQSRTKIENKQLLEIMGDHKIASKWRAKACQWSQVRPS